jgi:hypothetical protein
MRTTAASRRGGSGAPATVDDHWPRPGPAAPVRCEPLTCRRRAPRNLCRQSIGRRRAYRNHQTPRERVTAPAGPGTPTARPLVGQPRRAWHSISPIVLGKRPNRLHIMPFRSGHSLVQPTGGAKLMSDGEPTAETPRPGQQDIAPYTKGPSLPCCASSRFPG